jgi:hypothetical protein
LFVSAREFLPGHPQRREAGYDQYQSHGEMVRSEQLVAELLRQVVIAVQRVRSGNFHGRDNYEQA